MQILRIADPTEGAVYTCTMTSATGCTVALQSMIIKYILHDDFRSDMIDCYSNTVQLVNLSTTTHGTLLYRWDFGDGNTSAEENPRYTFSTSGIHQVGLFLSNPPSTCADSLKKRCGILFTLVGIEGCSPIVPAERCAKSIWRIRLYLEQWLESDSFEVSVPVETSGCLVVRVPDVSDTIRRTISEDPIDILAEGDIHLYRNSSSFQQTGCPYFLAAASIPLPSLLRESTRLKAQTNADAGSPNHSMYWNTFAEAEFTLRAIPDSRHNLITCSLPAQDRVSYVWDMGMAQRNRLDNTA
jgi:hypothetical protein